MRTLGVVVLFFAGFVACNGNVAPVPKPQHVCVALDQCHLAGDYNSFRNDCTNPTAPDGTECVLGTNTCLVGSTCLSGTCQGGTLQPDGADCDDHNACTDADTCSQGACVGGPAVVCAPQSVPLCYATTTCDPNSGCPTYNGPCNPNQDAPMPLNGCPIGDYYGNIDVGNQTFSVIMDSGSSTLAVAGNKCKTCEQDGITQLYVPSSSATAQNHNTSSTYGDGSGWYGASYKDSVSMQAKQTPVTMRLASMSIERGFFRPDYCYGFNNPRIDAYQGIMGLGSAANLVPYSDSYIVNMGKQFTIGQAYAVELCDKNGQMWMGGYDPDSIGAPVHFSTTDPNSPYFTVRLDDIAIGGMSLGFTADDFGRTVIDTGTTVAMLPKRVYQKVVDTLSHDVNLLAAFDPNQLFDPNGLSCAYTKNNASIATLDATLPRFTMTFPDRLGGTFTVDANATSSYLWPTDDGTGTTCFFSLLGWVNEDVLSFQTLLGNAVMRTSIVVFDNSQGLVGWTPQVDHFCPAHTFKIREETRNTRRDAPPPRLPFRGHGPHGAKFAIGPP